MAESALKSAEAGRQRAVDEVKAELQETFSRHKAELMALQSKVCSVL